LRRDVGAYNVQGDLGEEDGLEFQYLIGVAGGDGFCHLIVDKELIL